MDSHILPFLQEGLLLFRSGAIEEISFGRHTYQVAVRECNRIYWTLLHFTEQGELQEGFCDCEQDMGCPHVAASYLKICDTPTSEPIHIGFERHFFYHFFWLWAQRYGCSPKQFVCTQKGREGAPTEDRLAWEYLPPAQHADLLETLWESHAAPTPTTSILFSDVSSEEIVKWKQGRPSLALQFQLSPLAEFAKRLYMMDLENPFKVHVADPNRPMHCTIEGHGLRLSLSLSPDLFCALIPFLDTIHFPLPVFMQQRGPLIGMTLDQSRQVLRLQHRARPSHGSPPTWTLGGWELYPAEGLYPNRPHPLLDRDEIPYALLPEILDRYTTEVAKWMPLKGSPSTLRYQLTFTDEWDLQIATYLNRPGDLDDALFLNAEWIYQETEGWVRIRDLMFPRAYQVIPCSQMNAWLHEQRSWLTKQEGFQLHMTMIESTWTYQVTDILRFLPLDEGPPSKDRKDFGDWVYFRGQGFFAKYLSKPGALSTDLRIPKNQIGEFIATHIEELERVDHFFSPTLPIRVRGLSLRLLEKDVLRLEPIVELRSGYEHVHLEFCDPFVYVVGDGFIRLPKEMELPEGFRAVHDVPLEHATYFLEHELPKLHPFLVHVDPKTRIPIQADVHVKWLAYDDDQRLLTHLALVTEIGEIDVSILLVAVAEKKTWIATSAGLLDLTHPRFLWLRGMRSVQPSSPLCMEVLDWIRLEAFCPIQWIPSNLDSDRKTEAILKELRGWEGFPLPDLSAFQGELRPYQNTGLQWLWYLYSHHLSGLLCDDMGLGKTHQAMALLAAAHAKQGGPFLIVCPTSVLYHWKDRLSKTLPQLNVFLFHGLHRSLPDLDQNGVLLTSYGILRMDRAWIHRFQFEVVIYDEIHLAKNPSSQIHSALRSIKSRMRIGLTGTPIENHLRELKAQFDLILPGFLGSDAQFRTQFLIPIEKEQDEEKKLLIRQLIRPFSLRRKKQDVLSELPDKTEDTILCELSAEQLCLYQNLVNQEGNQIVRELKESEEVPYLHIFSILNYLKQICNHPALFYRTPEEYRNHTSGKWNACVEIIEEAVASDQKLVIFSQYLHMLDIFQLYLKDRGIGFAEIRGQTANRQGALERFHQDPDCKVFLGSLHAAGVGIDLTPASIVILYDRWWNAAKELQAIDRVHRIGQRWPVQVFKFLVPSTIEEKIDLMIHQKAQLLHDIVLPDDQRAIKTLSREDLIQLLSTLPTDFLAE